MKEWLLERGGGEGTGLGREVGGGVGAGAKRGVKEWLLERRGGVGTGVGREVGGGVGTGVGWRRGVEVGKKEVGVVSSIVRRPASSVPPRLVARRYPDL